MDIDVRIRMYTCVIHMCACNLIKCQHSYRCWNYVASYIKTQNSGSRGQAVRDERVSYLQVAPL